MAEDGQKACVVDSDFLIRVIRGKTDYVNKINSMKKIFFVGTTVYNAFELYRGAYAYAGNEELEKISRLLNELPVYSLTLSAARRAAAISVKLDRAGETLPPGDIIIAAIAIEENAVLLTDNKKHFERISQLELI